MITLDFETEAIVGNPITIPPKPVGLAVMIDGQSPFYETDWNTMGRYLTKFWAGDEDLLFHNAPFDIRVACHHFNLPYPEWHRVHDSLILAYLANPYSKSLGLKSLAVEWLGMDPTEQDVLQDWIVRNIPKATKKTANAFISMAPVDLVETYAIGDVIRTRELYDVLSKKVPLEAFQREQELQPILIESGIRGIRLNVEALFRDIELYTPKLELVSDMIRRSLNAPDLNLDSSKQKTDALMAADAITEWSYTPKGNPSSSKENLRGKFRDPELEKAFFYRSTLKTCLNTFLIPWSEKVHNGRAHPEWHQTRDGDYGTRTGRLSCSYYNLMNPPNPLDIPAPVGFPPLPVMRKYFLPEEGHTWYKRDWSGQELRILAHFEEGVLYDAYRDDPDLDPHSMAQELILEKTGKDFGRKAVKITGFQIIYGGGPQAIASQVGCSYQQAQELRTAYLAAMPGVAKLQAATKHRGQLQRSIRTWGGRQYYAEPPKMVNGQRRSYEYKLLNYLIQGSAADQAKQCIIDWYNTKSEDDIFMAMIHDEINISSPYVEGMEHLKRMMEQDNFDVPMRTEGFAGPNWGELEECE